MRQPAEDFEARVREVFERQAFLSLVGARLIDVSPGRSRLSVVSRPELTQQNGFIHGGVVASLADVAGGFAALTLFEPAANILTVEFKINLLAPAKGGLIIADGEVIKSGRTLTICSMRVYVEADGEPVLCAAGQQTLIQIAS